MVVLLGGLRYAVDPGFGVDDLALVGLSAVAVLAADAMRGRRERVASRLERRLAEDRLQIARDLHDSVAHSMATINVQAGVAAHVIDRHPEQAAAALEAIRVASRDVLDELAAMLSVLRDETPAARHPTPDLTSLEELVESSGRAGLHVDLQVSGDLDAVPPAVSTAAYRIVQEALTNVARHASTDRGGGHRCPPARRAARRRGDRSGARRRRRKQRRSWPAGHPRAGHHDRRAQHDRAAPGRRVRGVCLMAGTDVTS